MTKITQAQAILKAIGMPDAQQNEMSALTLLALCNLKETDKWCDATRNSLGVSNGIMKVYVSAFPDFVEFKKHSSYIAWETEVWLMEVPDHLIHFNGDRFLGPR